MSKSSKSFPSQFAGIGPKTIRDGKWDLDMPTPANANSLRTRWYSYVAALKEEGDLNSWAIAMRVHIWASAGTVHFEDRDCSAAAQALDFALKDEPVDQAERDFAEMMKGLNS